MPSYYVAAAHKSSGKTSLSIGIARAVQQMGHHVQCFKKGPDYIDPIWLRAASFQNCYNLDFNTQTIDEIKNLFSQHSNNSEFTIVEGNKGLFDGVDLYGSDSNAAMAKLINTPVILTIDSLGITRGIAPLLQGYQNFDDDIHYAGVILNKVGTSRHETKLRAAIEHYTDLKVIGAVSYNEQLNIKERHLGLQPANENADASRTIELLANSIKAQVDLDYLINNNTNFSHHSTNGTNNQASKSSTLTPAKSNRLDKLENKYHGLKVGIAKDEAFGFYYDDDIERFEQLGVQLFEIDMIHHQQLPEIDGLFIGGGFPETQMKELSSNNSMLQSVHSALSKGLPCYAECGGLMYLSNSIQWNKQLSKMVGFIDADVVMHKKPQGRGYAKFTDTENMPWNKLEYDIFAAHEFHYASLENLPLETKFAYKVNRGYGINGDNDGVVIKNVLASFAHLRSTESNPWVDRFVKYIHDIMSKKGIIE